jgi:hypothetical protein
MNIELDEVVALEVTDDALELAAGGAVACAGKLFPTQGSFCCVDF